MPRNINGKWQPDTRILLILCIVFFGFCFEVFSAGIFLFPQGTSPDLDCNGEQMTPGDVCQVQTYINGVPQPPTSESYEERVAASRPATPERTTGIVIGSLLLLAGATGVVMIWKKMPAGAY